MFLQTQPTARTVALTWEDAIGGLNPERGTGTRNSPPAQTDEKARKP
jgi:hypothetical protein